MEVMEQFKKMRDKIGYLCGDLRARRAGLPGLRELLHLRRFIYNYSGLAKPLSALSKLENKGLSFPWQPNGPEDLAFKALKKAFTNQPILHHFNPDLETWIESDASDLVVAAVLSQMGPDGLLSCIEPRSTEGLGMTTLGLRSNRSRSLLR